MSIRAFEIVYWKTWRVQKELATKRKCVRYIKENPESSGLNNLLMQTLPREIEVLEIELKRRKEHPEFTKGYGKIINE